MTRAQLVADDACPDCAYDPERWCCRPLVCSTCEGSGVIETEDAAVRVFGSDVSRWAIEVQERLYERGEIGPCSTCARFQRGRCERCEQEGMEAAQ